MNLSKFLSYNEQIMNGISVSSCELGNIACRRNKNRYIISGKNELRQADG